MATKPPGNNTLLLALLNSQASNRALRLQRVLSSSAGIDATLMLVGYTLGFTSVQLGRLLQLRLAQLAEGVAARAAKSLGPGETLIATMQLPTPAGRLADLQLGLKTLSGMCSDVRTFMRLWSCLAIWGWAKRVLLAPPDDPVLRAVGLGQVLANAAYVVFEHRAYLAGKGVYRGVPVEGIKRGWINAGRAFGAHLLLDYVRLWRVTQLRARQPVTAEKEDVVARKEEDRLWWKSLVVDSAYMPMAIHLSFESGFINEEVSGLLGMIVGYLSFKEAWMRAV